MCGEVNGCGDGEDKNGRQGGREADMDEGRKERAMVDTAGTGKGDG
jgi:hypothetical protein